MMDRRAFISTAAVCILAMPGANAQQPLKTPRVGWLSPIDQPEAAPAPPTSFVLGLKELGYLDGQTVILERRFAAGQPDRLPNLAAELVRANVDVIFAIGSVAVGAVRNATRTIPVVALDLERDPVKDGLAASLGHPGGNVTGIYLDLPQLSAKWLELLREAVPKLSSVAVLCAPAANELQLEAITTAARSFGVQVRTHTVGAVQDLERALAGVARQRPGAVVVLQFPVASIEGRRIAAFVTKERVPSIGLFRQFPEAGGLMSYGISLPDMFRRAATFVDKILKGTRPGDIPIERPSRFELVINLRTARALGLNVQPLLFRADHVIQ